MGLARRVREWSRLRPGKSAICTHCVLAHASRTSLQEVDTLSNKLSKEKRDKRVEQARRWATRGRDASKSHFRLDHFHHLRDITAFLATHPRVRAGRRFHFQLSPTHFPNLTSTLSATLSAKPKLWRPPATRTSARHLFLAHCNQHSILYSLEQCQIAS
jgi:hypothetical protein